MATKKKKVKPAEAWQPTSPVLMLRTCNADMRSTHTKAKGFQWPREGFVEALDWNPKAECGHGLHGLAWGKGSIGYLDQDPSSVWIVFASDASELVAIDGDKHKARRGNVLFAGPKDDAVKFLYGHDLYQDKSTVGVLGTATAGDRGTATAGVLGTATAGDRGTATAGDRGTATAGVLGTATAGVLGTATAGDRGTATAGVLGTATAGVLGTATAGDRGTATAGDRGTATAGDRGTIAILYWNGKRYKSKIATVKDEDGDGQLEPNVKYRLNETGEFEKVTA